MTLKSHESLDETQLRQRAREAANPLTLDNGTWAADALVSALLVDLRRSAVPTGVERLRSLTDDELFDLANDLARAIHAPMFTFKLPLGTIVIGLTPGCVAIGNEAFVQDAGVPGLHPQELARWDAHGPNLDLLRSEITQLTRGLGCRGLGLPAACFVADADGGTLLQFEPLADAAGVVLQLRTEAVNGAFFGAASRARIMDFARFAVADMRLLWRRRLAVGKSVMLIRRAAEAAVATMDGVSVANIRVAIDRHGPEPLLELIIEYEAVDDTMRKGPVLHIVERADVSPEAGGHRVPDHLIERMRHHDRLRGAGADGMIDDFAAAIATAAPHGLLAVLASLGRNHEITFTMPTASGATLNARLYWNDCVIRSSFSADGRVAGGSDCISLLRTTLPETIKDSALGRLLAEIVELPFDFGRRITSVEQAGEGARLYIESRDRLVNLSSGRIWEGNRTPRATG